MGEFLNSEVIREGDAISNVYNNEFGCNKKVLECIMNDVTSSNGNKDSKDSNNNESSMLIEDEIPVVEYSDKLMMGAGSGVPNSNGSDSLKETIKFYSDDYADSCRVECSVCDAHIYADRLRFHTVSQHNLPISEYKEKFGNQPVFVRVSYHLCKLCGREILLDKDSVASHVRSAHKVSSKHYNTEHMILRRKTLEIDDKKSVHADYKQPSTTSDDIMENQVTFEHEWFDGNTFRCNICQFTSGSLGSFKRHVKREHKSSLSRFDDSYTSSDVWYRCHCCDKQVYHERRAIKAHVEGHLLSMEQYAGLYERKRVRKLDSGIKEKMVSVMVQNDQEQWTDHEDDKKKHDQDPLEIATSSNNGSNDFEGLYLHDDPNDSKVIERKTSDQNHSDAAYTSSIIVAEIISDIFELISSHYYDDQKQMYIPTDGTSSVNPTPPSLADVFLFFCPFSDCDFHTDSRGIESGLADCHARATHLCMGETVSWRKVSLEARMEQLFAD